MSAREFEFENFTNMHAAIGRMKIALADARYTLHETRQKNVFIYDIRNEAGASVGKITAANKIDGRVEGGGTLKFTSTHASATILTRIVSIEAVSHGGKDPVRPAGRAHDK